MSSRKDNQLETLRTIATFEATAAVESRSKLIDEHNSAFRWIVASLFALNGGAIFSFFGKADFAVSSILPFGGFFLGIIFTFAAVISAQISDRQMIARMHSWGLYWTSVGETGLRDAEQERSMKSEIRVAEGWGKFARMFAFFSMAFFVVGVLAAKVFQEKTALELMRDRIERLERATPKQ